ncbi:MAG: CvpA family protein [Dehalococcoidales bacterium]|nr:CvpA family protein [Dehalococcoidales bacterium]
MNLFDIIVLLVFLGSFIGGCKEGAVKSSFSLLSLLIAIPTAGRFYYLAATILSFLPGKDWENFFGFFITMGIISAILHFIFFVPRHIVQKTWSGGFFYRLLGGAVNLFGTAVNLVLFVAVLRTYPFWSGLVDFVSGSRIAAWLMPVFNFVPAMLPELFQKGIVL